MVPYTVKAGDTLASIAKRFLGDPLRYHEIAQASGIGDPNRIFIGQQILIPVPELHEVLNTGVKMPMPVPINPDPLAPLPGVYAMDEISGSATRDYLPAMIAGAIILYALADKRRG